MTINAVHPELLRGGIAEADAGQRADELEPDPGRLLIRGLCFALPMSLALWGVIGLAVAKLLG